MSNPVRFTDDTRSLHDIGSFIMSYQPYQNAFINSLVNRIGRVIITSKMWTSPLAQFEMGTLELGETVEEIFVNIAKPHSYDPAVAEQEFMKREIPDARAAFHTMNYQKFYKTTSSNEQLRQAFLSWSGIDDFLAKIVESLYSGMNKDRYLVVKYMVAREALNGGFYTVKVSPIEGDGADPENAVQNFREYSNNLTILSAQYNRAHVETHTPIEDQVIMMTNHAEAVIGVKVLAAAFNMEQVDYLGQRVLIDNFDFNTYDTARLAELFENDSTYKPFTTDEITSLKAITGLKMDKSWFMIFTNLENFTQNYNGQGQYWNYFYHVWKTFSVSPYANAIAFTTQENTITAVAVSPATANLTAGATMTLTASVTGTGLIDKSVTWSISGQTKAGTAIDPQSGVLHAAKDEPADTAITVTATAVNGTTGTATITVTA